MKVIQDLQEQQFFYKRRKDEYQALKDQLISFDGEAETEAFARQMMAELYTRPLQMFINEFGERYFRVSPRTVIVSGSGLIPIVQQPKFHLKVEGKETVPMILCSKFQSNSLKAERLEYILWQSSITFFIKLAFA